MKRIIPTDQLEKDFHSFLIRVPIESFSQCHHFEFASLMFQYHQHTPTDYELPDHIDIGDHEDAANIDWFATWNNCRSSGKLYHEDQLEYHSPRWYNPAN